MCGCFRRRRRNTGGCRIDRPVEPGGDQAVRNCRIAQERGDIAIAQERGDIAIAQERGDIAIAPECGDIAIAQERDNIAVTPGTANRQSFGRHLDHPKARDVLKRRFGRRR